MKHSPRSQTDAAPQTAPGRLFWREDRRLLIGACAFAVAAFVADRLVQVFGIAR
jgi:hypothetical protein